MELSIVENLLTLRFDLVMTLALAAVFLFIGYFLQRRVGLLRGSSIPAAVIGGLLFALIVLALRAGGALGVTLDASLRPPLQTVFFTTIGFGATVSLLRAGGWRAPLLWTIATLLAVVQSIVGIAIATALGVSPALGIICGALTLTGGPATGMAFADRFEALGISGAGAIIIASATFGILAASLVGNPVATALIGRFRLARPRTGVYEREDASPRERGIESEAREENIIANIADDVAGADDDILSIGTNDVRAGDGEQPPLTAQSLLRNLAIILAAMGAGALLSLGLARFGASLPASVTPFFTLPGYIGAMIVAAVARNLDDRFGWLKIDGRAMEAAGAVALAFFLMIALMDLKLWQLAGLAVPMLVILGAQIVVMILYAVLVTFVVMGRDYEAAVTASGHIGFGLGITSNAVANMEALAARYRAAPRSFLVVPIVGAFFIDFSNVLVINLFINWLQ